MEQAKEKKGFKSLIKQFFCKERISRILPSLILSLAIPLIVFISIPLENYTGNIKEMRFSFSDVLGRAVLCGLGVFAILFITQFIAPKIVYLILRGVYLGVALLIYLQANFINFGLTTLAGDDAVTVIEMVGKSTVIINSIIWVVVLGGTITLSVFEKKLPIIKLITFVLALVVFLPTTLTTTVNAVTTDFSKGSAFEEMKAENPNYTPTFLTTENVNSLGSQNNIVVFIIDRLDNQKYMAKENGNIPSKYKKYFNDWGGFTHFNDNVSLYGRTYPSVCYMLTRQEFNPEKTRKEYFEYAYNNNSTLSVLNQLGYSVNVYTDTYYGYYDAYYLPDYIDNLQTASEDSLYRETTQKHNLFRSNMMMSMYRFLPFAFKDSVGGISSTSMNKYVVYKSDELTHPEASTDLKENWEAISSPQEPFTTGRVQKQFTFIHVSGMHNVPYNENWGTAKGKDKKNLDISLKHSFNILDEYIAQMKELGVYDNSTIIVTGDHAYTDDNFKLLSKPKLTSLFVKPSTACEGNLETSQAPVSHEDLWATIFTSEKINYDKEVFGSSVFEVNKNEQRERRFVWHTVSTTQTSFTEDVYKITGKSNSAQDFNNWKVQPNSKKYNRELYD